MDPQSLEFREVLESDCAVRRCFRDFLQAQESPNSRTVPDARYRDDFRGASSCSLYRTLLFWEQAQDFKRFESFPSTYRNSRALGVYKVFTAAWSGPSTATIGRVNLNTANSACVALLRQKSAPCGTSVAQANLTRSESPASATEEPASAPIDAWTRVVLRLHEPDGAPANVFDELQKFCFEFLERWAFPMFIEFGVTSLSLARLRLQEECLTKCNVPQSPGMSSRSTTSLYEVCSSSVQWTNGKCGSSDGELRGVASLEERLRKSLRGYSDGSYSHFLYVKNNYAEDSPSFRLLVLLDGGNPDFVPRPQTTTKSEDASVEPTKTSRSVESELQAFEVFLTSRCARSLLLFWQESEKFASLEPGYYASLALQRIYGKFLAFGGQNQVFARQRVDAQALRDVVASLHSRAHSLLLAPLQEHAFNMLTSLYDLWTQSPERRAWVQSMYPVPVLDGPPIDHPGDQDDIAEHQARDLEHDSSADASQTPSEDVAAEIPSANTSPRRPHKVPNFASPYATPSRPQPRGRSKSIRSKKSKSVSTQGKATQKRFASPAQKEVLSRKSRRMASLSYSCGSKTRSRISKNGTSAPTSLSRSKIMDDASSSGVLRKSMSAASISSTGRRDSGDISTSSGSSTGKRKSDSRRQKTGFGSRPVFFYDANASAIRPLAIFAQSGAKKLTSSKFRKHLEEFARRDAEKAASRKNDENREPNNFARSQNALAPKRRSRARKRRPSLFYVPLQRTSSVDSAVEYSSRVLPPTIPQRNPIGKKCCLNFDIDHRAVITSLSRREPVVLVPRHRECIEEAPCVPPITSLGGKMCTFVNTEGNCATQPRICSSIPCELPSMPAVSSRPLGYDRARSSAQASKSALSKRRSKRARSMPGIPRALSLVSKKIKKKRKSKKHTSRKPKASKKGRKKTKNSQKTAPSDSGGSSSESSGSECSTPTSLSATSSTASSATSSAPPSTTSSNSSSTTSSTSSLLQDSVPSLPSVSTLPSLPPILALTLGRTQCPTPSSKRVRFSLPRAEGASVSFPTISLSTKRIPLRGYECVSNVEAGMCYIGVSPGFDDSSMHLVPPVGSPLGRGEQCAAEEEVDEENDCVATDEVFASPQSRLSPEGHRQTQTEISDSAPRNGQYFAEYSHEIARSDTSETSSDDLRAGGDCAQLLHGEGELPRVPSLKLSGVEATSNHEASNDGEMQDAGGQLKRLSHFVDWQCLLDTGASHSIAPESLSTILGVTPHTARKAIVGSGESIVLNVLSLTAFLKADQGRVLRSNVAVSIRPDQCGAGSRIGVDVLHKLKAVIAPRPSYGPQPIDTIDVFCVRKRPPVTVSDRSGDEEVADGAERVDSDGEDAAGKKPTKVERERATFQRPFIPVKFLKHAKRSGGGKTTCVDVETMNVLIDTGAARSAVSQKVRKALELPTVGRLDVRVANGNVDERETVQVCMLVAKRCLDMEVSVRNRPCLLGMDFVTQANVRIFFS